MSKQTIEDDSSSTHGVLDGDVPLTNGGSTYEVDETPPILDSTGTMEENERVPATGKQGHHTKIPTIRVPYVNLFKNNRMTNENHKLTHFPSGTNTLSFSSMILTQ